MLERLLVCALVGAARAVTGLRSLWLGAIPSTTQRIYFANHGSHGDFILLWASLPPELRARTRPVAGADYWGKGALRGFLINRVFHGVLIERQPSAGGGHPLEPINKALAAGDSLILFPEGTRNMADEVRLLPFKSGIYHISKAHPEVELIPVWLDNLSRVMPKGHVLPVPLLCTLSFGSPVPPVKESETKQAFLGRAREALLSLAPPEGH